MAIEIKVPAMGESVTEATVGRWFKQQGEAVSRDEPLLELETDKVTIEVPAPSEGALESIAVNAHFLTAQHDRGAPVGIAGRVVERTIGAGV